MSKIIISSLLLISIIILTYLAFVQPVVFYDHFYDFGIHDTITELIEARKRASIHCRSPVKILHAVSEGYAAQIGDSLVMKLGQFDWNPAKEVNLDGSWQMFVNKGSDYQLWLRN